MGARLMTEALSAARWCALVEARPLSDRAWRVLVVMAHRALDNEGRNERPARTYFGGWEILALEALGYREYVRNGAAHRAIARAISELQERGLVRVSKVGGRGFTHYEVLPTNGSRLSPLV
jgi:hypothetical protein